MSKFIQGSKSRIERLREQLRSRQRHSYPGRLAKVSSDIQAIVNRPTNIGTLEKYLRDGWNWNKFQPIVVAQFPPDSPHGQKLLDGDHRRHMHRLVFEPSGDIEAYVIDVADEREYHLLFAELNKDSRKQCSPNETFLHQYLGGDAHAVLTGNSLFNCRLAVCGSPDDPERGYVGDKTHPLINVGGFCKALRNGEANVKLAATTINTAWGRDRKVQSELLDGLSLLYKVYGKTLSSTRSNNKIAWEFRTWFSEHVSIKAQKNTARYWKNLGGNVHHFASESIARGILKDFLAVEIPGGSKNKGTKLKQSLLDKLFESKES